MKTDRPVFTGISSGESERSSRLRARMSLQWMVAWFHWNWVMEVLVVCAGGGVAKTPALCVQRSAFGLAWSRSVRASAPAVERTLVCAACLRLYVEASLAAARGAQVHPQDGMEESHSRHPRRRPARI